MEYLDKGDSGDVSLTFIYSSMELCCFEGRDEARKQTELCAGLWGIILITRSAICQGEPRHRLDAAYGNGSFLDFLDLREAQSVLSSSSSAKFGAGLNAHYACCSFLRPLAWPGFNNLHVFHDFLPYNRPSSLCLTWSESQGPTEVSTPYRPLRLLRLITSHPPLFPQDYPGGPATVSLSDISTEQALTSFGAPSLTCQRLTTPRMRVRCHPRRFQYPPRGPLTLRKHFGPS